MNWLSRLRRKPAMATQTATAPATASGPYALPNNLEEHNRLDFQHFMLRQAFQGDFAAPVQQPQSILDVGTGTGRWAVEMARRFPDANVVGLDITEPKADSQTERRPDNYVFVIGNVLEGLPFADASFDFVHMRLLFSGIPADRWLGVMRELARVTRPGGWVESVEATGLRNGSPPMMDMAGWFRELFRRRGIDQEIALHIPEFMRQAGLQQVLQREAAIPMGQHGGRIGTLLATDGMALMRALKAPVVKAGLTTEADYDAHIAAVQHDFATAQAVQPNYITFGQKPR